MMSNGSSYKPVASAEGSEQAILDGQETLRQYTQLKAVAKEAFEAWNNYEDFHEKMHRLGELVSDG